MLLSFTQLTIFGLLLASCAYCEQVAVYSVSANTQTENLDHSSSWSEFAFSIDPIWKNDINGPPFPQFLNGKGVEAHNELTTHHYIMKPGWRFALKGHSKKINGCVGAERVNWRLQLFNMNRLLRSNREVSRRCGGIRGGGWEGAWPRGLVYRKLLYEKVSQPATSGAMSYRDRWERQHSCRQLLPVAAHWTKRTTGHPSSFSSNTMFTAHVKPINLKLCSHCVGECRKRPSMLNYMQVHSLLMKLDDRLQKNIFL